MIKEQEEGQTWRKKFLKMEVERDERSFGQGEDEREEDELLVWAVIFIWIFNNLTKMEKVNFDLSCGQN